MSKSKTEEINLPTEYIKTLKTTRELYTNIFCFEIGLRLAIDKHLTQWLDEDWWNKSLKQKLPSAFEYAEKHKKETMGTFKHSIHYATIGHLIEIVKAYKETFIPEVFPSIHVFLGHTDYIIKIRNCCCHMHPNIDNEYLKLLQAETLILKRIINSKIS